MADEEQTEAEETTDAPEEAAAEEAAPEVEEPAAEEAAEEPAAEEAADEPAQASAPAPAAEPEEVLHPKQIRSRRRSTHTGEALPQRDAETRASERAEARKKAANDRRRYRAKHSGGDAGQGTPAADREPGAKKVRLGKVVSDKGDKTITVKVEVVHRHRRYEKVIRRSDTLHAHDERNEAGEGDTVRVIESRPLSRTKRWRLVEIVEKAR